MSRCSKGIQTGANSVEALLDPVQPADHPLLDPVQPADHPLLDPVQPADHPLLDPVQPADRRSPIRCRLVCSVTSTVTTTTACATSTVAMVHFVSPLIEEPA